MSGPVTLVASDAGTAGGRRGGSGEKLFGGLVMTRTDIFDLIGLCMYTHTHTGMKAGRTKSETTSHSSGSQPLLGRCVEMLILLLLFTKRCYCSSHLYLLPVTHQALIHNSKLAEGLRICAAPREGIQF